MQTSLIIPLSKSLSLTKDHVADINRAAQAQAVDELVLVLSENGAVPPEVEQIDTRIKRVLVRSPKKFGKEGALKRGLQAASCERIVTLEHRCVRLNDVLAHETHYQDLEVIVLGLFIEPSRQIVWEFLKKWILEKDLLDAHCAFRCLSRKQLDPILGRIYLDRDGFNTEWAYIAKKLGVHCKIIPITTAAILPEPNLKMCWNLLRIRNWHFPRINTKDEHMSGKDMAQMYANESHHWWFVAKAAFMKQILQKWVRLENGLVLDAGCGTGHNMRFLAEGGDYIGVDVSEQALNFCQHNGHKTLVRANLDCLPFKDDSFDLVFALDVIEHTQNPWRVIRQLRRVLKKDGRIIIRGQTATVLRPDGKVRSMAFVCDHNASPKTVDIAVELLALPDQIRGYGQVKEASVVKAKARYEQLAKDLVNPPQMIAPQIAAE